MFFQSWSRVGTVALVTVLTYVAMVVLVRVSGKRSLAQMNAFDFIVTVALGSTLATTILSTSVAMAEGVTAIAVLLGLQFGVSWLTTRSGRIKRLVKAEPALLVYKGELLEEALRRERVDREEVIQAIRNEGAPSLADVDAVILETNGTFSVSLQPGGEGPGHAFEVDRGSP